ncbi:MAG: MFS transporter [Anaerolineales bacterium]|nr:MFS transporter [Anaerolineales bacterium]MDW8227915.1 MFS transporter [Anaerolineales bacterium]
MRNRLATIFRSFPAQFWLVAFGVLLSSAGSSLIWPFQLVYISETLQAPLTTAGTLVSLSSFVGLVVSFLGGSIADRFGRKPIMFLAQTAHGLAYLLMSHAETYAAFILPMTILGAAMPFYAIGSDAMMADLLPPQRRASAFAILRMTNNAGFAIGPTLGGLLVVRSYTLAFYAAAAAMFFYSLLLFFFTHETLQRQHDHPQETLLENLLGYRHVFADRRFIAFVALVAFGMIGPLMMWVFLAVYTKTYYGLSETLYAWIPTTNALMCVFVQYFVTLFTRRHPPTQMIALGMFVYALGVGSVAWMSDFWGFWTSMVVFTLGELILIPTGTTYAAGLAPETLRGRYLSLYWLTWGLARTLAPLLGGVLNDLICPQAIWYGGLILGLLSAAALWRLSRAPSSYLMTRDEKKQP